MENTQEQPKTGGEQAFVLTSTKHTLISFKDVPFKTKLKILFGGNVWITTKSQIQIKQDTEPVPVNDGIELFINTNNPKDGK